MTLDLRDRQTGFPRPSRSDQAMPPRSRRALAEWLWADRRHGLVVAFGTAVAWGVSAGIWTPRGPRSTLEGLSAILISVVVGGVVGLLLRSRWAMVLGPVLFAVAFEITRGATDGPLVDRVQLSTEYGLIAFVVGRGFHGMLVLFPMVVAAALGCAVARLMDDRPEDLDLREDATRLDVPVFLAQGAHEPRGRAVLADEWFDMLDAPSTERVEFATSGHRPMFQQPERFHSFMVNTVLTTTSGDN